MGLAADDIHQPRNQGPKLMKCLQSSALQGMVTTACAPRTRNEARPGTIDAPTPQLAIGAIDPPQLDRITIEFGQGGHQRCRPDLPAENQSPLLYVARWDIFGMTLQGVSMRAPGHGGARPMDHPRSSAITHQRRGETSTPMTTGARRRERPVSAAPRLSLRSTKLIAAGWAGADEEGQPALASPGGGSRRVCRSPN